MLLFDDLHHVGHGVAETDFVGIVAVVVVVVTLLVSRGRRRGSVLSPVSQKKKKKPPVKNITTITIIRARDFCVFAVFFLLFPLVQIDNRLSDTTAFRLIIV